jgi:hypothetical protein
MEHGRLHPVFIMAPLAFIPITTTIIMEDMGMVTGIVDL